MATPTISNNTPGLGDISWAAFNIQYQGVAYSLDAGSTSERWTWWRFATGLLESGPVLPLDLTDDDLVVFANREGIGVRIQATSWIDGDLLVDGSVTTRALSADAITTELLLANEALVQGILRAGDVVARAVATEGLSIGTHSWNEDTGFTIPGVVYFPPTNAAEAMLWAKLIARSLTIENFFKLMGRTNEISTGASLVLANGVTAPTEPPQIEPYWELVTTLATTGAVDLRGLVWESATSTWLTLRLIDAASCKLERYSQEGALLNTVTIPNDGKSGVTRNSTTGRIYVASAPYETTSNGGSKFKLQSVATDFTDSVNEGVLLSPARDATGVDFAFPSNGRAQVFHYSSTFIAIATIIGPGGNYATQPLALLWEYDSAARIAVGRKSHGSINKVGNPGADSAEWAGVNYGKPPGMAGQSANGFTSWSRDHDPDFQSSPVGTYFTDVVPRAHGRSIRGAAMQGASHVALDSTGKIYKYQGQAVTGEVAYSFRDSNAAAPNGEHETPLSPPVALSVPLGAAVTVRPNPPASTGDPDSPDRSTIYARTNTAGSWIQQGEVIPPADSLKMVGISSTGTVHGSRPGFSQDAEDTAEFESAVNDVNGPMIHLRGDGSWRLGDLTGAANGDVLHNGTAIGVASSTVDTSWHTVGAAGEIPFQNGHGTQAEAVQYRKTEDGSILLRGRVSRVNTTLAANNTAMFTLPEGYRPSSQAGGLIVWCQGAKPAECVVETTGVVRVLWSAAGLTAPTWLGVPSFVPN